MLAGLPFDLGDVGIVTEVVEGLAHELRDGRRIAAAEVGIGDETLTASEAHQKSGPRELTRRAPWVAAWVRNSRS